jgi:hypothetical protein
MARPPTTCRITGSTLRRSASFTSSYPASRLKTDWRRNAGMLPLALGRGIGAELRVDTGVACVGGILVSGVLTLILMPVLYDLMTRRQCPATPE